MQFQKIGKKIIRTEYANISSDTPDSLLSKLLERSKWSRYVYDLFIDDDSVLQKVSKMWSCKLNRSIENNRIQADFSNINKITSVVK